MKLILYIVYALETSFLQVQDYFHINLIGATLHLSLAIAPRHDHRNIRHSKKKSCLKSLYVHIFFLPFPDGAYID